jgi:hypothetical protein
MSEHMMHVTEEELILHYYREDTDDGVERHLASCPRCRDELQRLTQVLTLVDAEGLEPAEAPGPGFERTVWARLAPHLPTRRASLMARLFQGIRPWALASGVAALVLAAFLAGRFSTDISSPAAIPEDAVADIAERVLIVAVVDHLDRSQLVLLEVLNADFEQSIDLAGEQSRARELVASNRLYRQTAVQTGDDQTSDVLDELERVLLEIANTPEDASRTDLEALRARIAAGGLLFKVRVVHSEMRERERQSLLPGSTS